MDKVNHQPSMDDILASIRHVMDEDGDAVASDAVEPVPIYNDEHSASDTDRAAAGGSVHEPDREPALANDDTDFGDHSDGSPASSPIIEEVSDMQATARALAIPPEDASAADVSRPMADPGDRAGGKSLDVLSHLVVRVEAGQENTLDGLIADLLRPMLRDWVDRELPAIVERLVSSEIRRISL